MVGYHYTWLGSNEFKCLNNEASVIFVDRFPVGKGYSHRVLNKNDIGYNLDDNKGLREVMIYLVSVVI